MTAINPEEEKKIEAKQKLTEELMGEDLVSFKDNAKNQLGMLIEVQNDPSKKETNNPESVALDLKEFMRKFVASGLEKGAFATPDTRIIDPKTGKEIPAMRIDKISTMNFDMYPKLDIGDKIPKSMVEDKEAAAAKNREAIIDKYMSVPIVFQFRMKKVLNSEDSTGDLINNATFDFDKGYVQLDTVDENSYKKLPPIVIHFKDMGMSSNIDTSAYLEKLKQAIG